MAARSTTRIAFPRAYEAVLEETPLPEVGPGEVQLRTEFSLVSTGTEGIVFGHLVAPGSLWSKYAAYPFYPGYASVGRIEAIGDGVDLPIGHRVVWRRPHAARHILSLNAGGVIDYCLPVPDGVDADEALWFALAHIAFRGAQVARHALGDEVLIVGAGPVGQMSVRWARASGASRIVVVDPFAMRLELARSGGATAVIASAIEHAETAIIDVNGSVPSIIIDTTGNAAVFVAIQELAPRFGRIVMLGNTGTSNEQRLTDYLIHDGLTVAGAQDIHEHDGWTQQRVQTLFLELVADGRIDASGLITHRFAPRDCQAAYELPLSDRGHTMGILFDWTAP